MSANTAANKEPVNNKALDKALEKHKITDPAIRMALLFKVSGQSYVDSMAEAGLDKEAQEIFCGVNTKVLKAYEDEVERQSKATKRKERDAKDRAHKAVTAFKNWLHLPENTTTFEEEWETYQSEAENVMALISDIFGADPSRVEEEREEVEETLCDRIAMKKVKAELKAKAASKKRKAEEVEEPSASEDSSSEVDADIEPPTKVVKIEIE